MYKQDQYAVFIIQCFWRNKKYQLKQKNRVKYYYTSIQGQSHKVKQNQHKIELLLELKGWDVLKQDIVEEKSLQQLCSNYREKGYELPLLLIDNYFLGTADQIQELEDNQFLDEIYEKIYLQRCLLCNQDRIGNEEQCSGCQKSFTFFSHN